MDNNKEYIVAAAYKVIPLYWSDSNKWIILKHPNLRDSSEFPSDDIYRIRIGRHHAEILHQFGKLIEDDIDGGFYTSWGRYVNRIEAARIAIACGQCQEGKLIMGDRLDSSDIFK